MSAMVSFDNEEFTVMVPADIHEKMMVYASVVNGEISGLGRVRFESNCAYVEDVFIFEQRSSTVDTELDTASIHRFIEDMISRGEDIDDVRLWWHSHASVDTFFSTTDMRTIDGLSSMGPLVSIVVNKRRDIIARLDVRQPIHIGISVPVQIYYKSDDEMIRAIKREVQEKVKYKKAFAAAPSRHRRHGGLLNPEYYEYYDDLEDILLEKMMSDGCCDIDGGCCGRDF